MVGSGPAETKVTPQRLGRWTLVATGAWLAEAALYAAQIWLFGAQSGGPIGAGPAIAQSAVSSLLWVPFTVMALWLAFRWPVTSRRRYVLVHLAGLVGVVVGRAVAVVWLNPLLVWYPGQVPGWGELLLRSVFNNLLLYVLMTGLAHAVFYHRAVRLSEARSAAARFRALASQLQPHFLFNALNTIAALIPSRPEAAERMIVDLSALLRFSVDRDTAALIPLEEEIEIGQAYLSIEEHRFADRLQVVVDVADEVGGAAVPPFVLQPLLENAVRHGLAPGAGVSTLQIRASRSGNEVEIRVLDDGVGLRAGRAPGGDGAGRPEGVGLANVERRLEGAFGSAARLELVDRRPSGVEVRIVLPFRPVAASGRRR